MKKTDADIFRINSPYGIIIRLSDLAYSWFNRKYLGLGNDNILQKHLPLFLTHSFVNKLTHESVLKNLETYAQNNRSSGMDMGKEITDGEGYLRIWLYSDKYFPYNDKGLIKSNMDRYKNVLSEVEKIIFTSPSSS